MINLNPIVFKGITGSFSTNGQRQPIHTKSEGDVFVRTLAKDKLESQASDKSEFMKWADEFKLKEKLPEILLNPDNIIGKGFNHKAYTIPNCEDYVLRTSVFADFEGADFSNIKITEKEPDDLKINIGQEVACIEFNDKNNILFFIEVLKKQKGTPIGNPPPSAICDEDTGEMRVGELPYDAKERKDKYAESLRKLAELPDETYEKLISDYKEIENAGYSMDYYNSNNLFIDEENRSINFIDMNDIHYKPNYGNLLYVLTNIYYFDTYTYQYDSNPVSNEQKGEALKNTVEIINKFIKAMKKQGVKFDYDSQSSEFLRFMLSMPMTYLCRTFDTDEKWNYLKEQGVLENY